MLTVQVTALVSCVGTIPHLDEKQIRYAQTKWFGTSLLDLQRGRELYIVKCSGCHPLYEPANRSELQWEEILKEMKSRVKISEDETALMLKYLVSARNSSLQRDSLNTD